MKNLAERGQSFTTPADPEVGVQTGTGIEVNRNVRISARVRTHDEHRDGSRDGVTHTVFVTEIFPCLAPSFDWTLQAAFFASVWKRTSQSDEPLWPLPGDSVADEGCPLPHAILRMDSRPVIIPSISFRSFPHSWTGPDTIIPSVC